MSLDMFASGPASSHTKPPALESSNDSNVSTLSKSGDGVRKRHKDAKQNGGVVENEVDDEYNDWDLVPQMNNNDANNANDGANNNANDGANNGANDGDNNATKTTQESPEKSHTTFSTSSQDKKQHLLGKKHIFIYYLLFIIYYLLFIIYYLLFIIYYLLFIIYYLLFICLFLLLLLFYFVEQNLTIQRTY